MTKGIGGERGIWGWFIIMRMVTAMAMATATVCGKKGLGKGGERGNGRMDLYLLIVFTFDVQNCHCKNEQRQRGGRRRMWFEFTTWAFYFLD